MALPDTPLPDLTPAELRAAFSAADAELESVRAEIRGRIGPRAPIVGEDLVQLLAAKADYAALRGERVRRRVVQLEAQHGRPLTPQERGTALRNPVTIVGIGQPR